MQPEHRGQADRHFAATAAALKYYGEWFGAYPFPQITIVDPAWQSDSGGMEYPTLFTAGTSWLSPRQSNDPEAVTVHEAGHQFWYSIVASNEVTSAWMDEGLNTFSDSRVQSVAFTPNYLVQRFFGGFIPWQFRDIPLSRATDDNYLDSYRRVADRDSNLDAQLRCTGRGHHRHHLQQDGAVAAHARALPWWERLQRVMSIYFQRFRFKHPQPSDFFEIVSAESGRDMTWFFDQVFDSSNMFDYAAERLESTAVTSRGFREPSPGAPLDVRGKDERRPVPHHGRGPSPG